MKVVAGPDGAEEKLAAARREGEAYFSNDSVYLERFLERPRHVEVQILADEHGAVRHLGERDCSLQRRHQKLIEEAPSPALSDGLRAEIHDAARKGVRAADYTNAGTVEFLVAESDRAPDEPLGTDADFYFLEVNTRIQVEHTVTEALTGLDVVNWQLRVAAGEPLDFEQSAVTLDGHAIEYRINAENAAEGFQPATGGRLETYDPPGGIGVRVDDALRAGDELVTDYDSMIAKLIVRAGDRSECLARSRRALGEYDVEGVVTVVPFHRLMLTDDAFRDGTHTTRYLDEELDPEAIRAAQERWGTDPDPGDGDGDDEAEPDATEREFIVEVNGKRFEVALEERGAPPIPSPSEVGGARTGGSGSGSGGRGRGRSRPQQPTDEGDDGSGAAAGGETIEAEMQGTVLSVAVAKGDTVEPGDVVCVLEAMKMENDVIADRGGTVAEVAIAEGEGVDMGDVLLALE